MFEEPILARPIFKKNGEIIRYDYMDGEIINVMAKVMNFTPIYVSADPIAKHGYQLPNGTFTGGLAAAEYGYADIVANHRVKIEYNTTKVYFLKYITLGRFYFIVPNPPISKEVLVSMLMSFDLSTLIVSIVFLACFPVSLYLISRIEAKIYQAKLDTNLSNGFIKMIGAITNVSVRLPIYQCSRIFFITVLLFSLIESSVIQSLFVKNLNTVIVHRNVKTLNDILDHDYEISIGTQLSMMLKDVDGSRMARKLRSIAQNGASVTGTNNEKKAKIMKPRAIFLPELQVDKYIDQDFDNITKRDLFIKVPELAYSFYESMMVPKNSPYQKKFNEIIVQAQQAGIIEYQLDVAKLERYKTMVKRAKNGNLPKPPDKEIKIQDLGSIFYTYLILNSLALCVFASELLISFLKKFLKTKQ